MRVLSLLAALPLCAQAYNIVLSNDDGWAEINIRQLYNVLTAAGNSVVLSAPAENESGTGSSDATPKTLTSAGEFNSIPAGAPGIGFNASNPRLNYVNSYPVTAMRNGIQNVSTKYFAKPDFAVAGFNVGSNLGATTLISGTVGAATEAVKEGVPAIAFSGTTGTQISYTSATPNYVNVYSSLSLNVTETILKSGTPYLPSGVYLNVNFPASTSTSCASLNQFKFVLSRINSASSSTAADVSTCGSTRLPTESKVVGTSGCYASISVGSASTKGDSTAANQAVVLAKLKSILSCLPA